MNIKPILPGHVLVIPFRPVQRVTDLTPEEVMDLFTSVQKVQRMLARRYFKPTGEMGEGSFNLAIRMLGLVSVSCLDTLDVLQKKSLISNNRRNTVVTSWIL